MWTTLTRVGDERKKLGLFRIVIPKVALRIFTVLQEVGSGDEFAEEFIEAYTKCRRCGLYPCICSRTERSTDVHRAERIGGQERWSIQQWQEHLRGLYGTVNNEMELWEVMGQVRSEIDEAEEAVLKMDQAQREGDSEKFEKHRRETIEELTQALAWLIGVCNHRGVVLDSAPINLEERLVTIYGKGCPRGEGIPCQCRGFSWLEPRKDPEALAQLSL